ncbi:tRNA uracil 4-sulfurtransferase ThiI [Streptococcus hyointestinalis]|uniref:Probable tRNA sulfurtransferase n=1 Tax=Streptococcus hyointestinalis TaxID=1337 RepID=A0A380KEN3_9STRE|nr:tRNA uracil 4-sulfurtransferase ThiI [Streptococcus hyointestinalis]MCI6871168.1 tRNA 4-thiouridine(8) synthase ThiI [Streptococcus hyointestinalis]MDD6384095.1 tRNA 4-thiouridine(8) synthase ThiI [Streptococcus hyointestinalis]MDD7356280.1 tRNA 4-thiouridine(8) synthase ThiI [Streptococcus hyointestinalis]MDY4553089.1 tRNA uracil 4-sulfurtransferase ThiI [Streptococcus hyointestinalis]SUN62710.1 thiamine biosynthesis protein [Streptococcus hyointestinalis]
MQYSEIMVRYGELSTKGKNRMRFINKLKQNMKHVLSIYPDVTVQADRDRAHVYLNGTDYQPVAESLKQIFGIQAFSPSYKVEKTVPAIKKAVQDLMTSIYQDGMTFKITGKRSDHTFELDSRELNQVMGNAVFDVLPQIKAQMKQPDVNLKIEIRDEAAYLSYENIKGAGGLPVGTAGRGMLMLSGGIDSPVAGYLALKRGVDIEAVHFASPPYTSPGALKKAQDLTRKLTKFGGNIQFIEVPFTEIQEEIKEKAPEAYLMTLTRRFMMRITDRIREERRGLVIINGESLGQVASQTLESMQAINAVTTTPVIRPVVTMDKLEIIDIAQKIDTFDISIQPFEDCCTIFAPDRPKTNPKIKNVEQYEARLDVEGLVERAVAGIIITEITPQADNDALDDLIDDLL